MTDIEVRAAAVRRVVEAALVDAGDRVEATAGAIRALLAEAGHVADVLVDGATLALSDIDPPDTVLTAMAGRPSAI